MVVQCEVLHGRASETPVTGWGVSSRRRSNQVHWLCCWQLLILHWFGPNQYIQYVVAGDSIAVSTADTILTCFECIIFIPAVLITLSDSSFYILLHSESATPDPIIFSHDR